MRFLLDSLRRLFAAALVIVAVACVVEVVLRWCQPRADELTVDQLRPGLPVLPSRTTRFTLPSAWTGFGRHAETGAVTPLRVNSFGLRGDEPCVPKPRGAVRIVCLGDETTIAAGLREEEAYPAQLAERLRGLLGAPVEVINAGLPGGCPLTETILYRQRLAVLEPDVVLVHVDLSDAAEDFACRPTLRLDAQGRPAAVVHATLEVSAGPLARWEQQFAVASWMQGWLRAEVAGRERPTPFEEFQERLHAWRSNAPLNSAQQSPAVLAPLGHLKELLDRSSTRLVISTCPDAWQAAELLRGPTQDPAVLSALRAPAEALRGAARQWEAPFVDATDAFLADPHPERLYQLRSHRLSVAGHALYADLLARVLTAAESPVSASRP